MRGTKSRVTVRPLVFSLPECDPSDRFVRPVTKLVAAVLVPRSEILDSLRLSTGTPLAFPSCAITDLITAGRRECWGSQIGGAEGHRNDAMPFCLYGVQCPPSPRPPHCAAAPPPKKTPLTAETAEKKTPRILGVLCVLHGKRRVPRHTQPFVCKIASRSS